MQKWEYLYVVFDVNPKTKKPTYTANGVEHPIEGVQSVFTVMNKLGADGWELVVEPQVGICTFKRPHAN